MTVDFYQPFCGHIYIQDTTIQITPKRIQKLSLIYKIKEKVDYTDPFTPILDTIIPWCVLQKIKGPSSVPK